MDVELIEHGIRVLGQARSEDDHFKVLTDNTKKVIHMRPFEDIDVVALPVNIHRDNKVGILDRLVREQKMSAEAHFIIERGAP